MWALRWAGKSRPHFWLWPQAPGPALSLSPAAMRWICPVLPWLAGKRSVLSRARQNLPRKLPSRCGRKLPGTLPSRCESCPESCLVRVGRSGPERWLVSVCGSCPGSCLVGVGAALGGQQGVVLQVGVKVQGPLGPQTGHSRQAGWLQLQGPTPAGTQTESEIGSRQVA